MSELRETTHRLFEAWNNRDWDAIRRSLHPEYTYIGPDGHESRGVDTGLQAGWVDNASGLPDGRIEIVAVHVDDDTVITEFSFNGTHTGSWSGIPPTGKRVGASVCNVMRFRDGKVSWERDYLNLLDVLVQLGVVQTQQP